MQIRVQDFLPVVLSILIIVTVAFLEKQSKLFASMAATMPVTITLAIWIVYSSNNGDKLVVGSFTQNLLIGLIPTALFVLSAWLASKAGLKLIPILGIGYSVWAISSWILILVRRALGIG